MEFQDLRERRKARQRHGDHAIHAAGANEGRIQQLRVIAGADHDHAWPLGDTVQQLRRWLTAPIQYWP